jgi:hypothetical protein
VRSGKRREDHGDFELAADLDRVPNCRDALGCFGYPVGRPPRFDELVLHINDKQSAALSHDFKGRLASFIRSPRKLEDFLFRIHIALLCASGLSEFESRPAVQRDEFHAIESERCRHGTDPFNLRFFFEDGGVKPRCLFGLAIEPKKRRDFLQWPFSFKHSVSYL